MAKEKEVAEKKVADKKVADKKESVAPVPGVKAVPVAAAPQPKPEEKGKLLPKNRSRLPRRQKKAQMKAQMKAAGRL